MFKLLEEDKTYLRLLIEREKTKIPVKNPGILNVPEGKNVEDKSLENLKGLVRKKGFEEISKALINLKVWNKKKNITLSKWADNMQEKLAKWVAVEREKDQSFGK